MRFGPVPMTDAGSPGGTFHFPCPAVPPDHRFRLATLASPCWSVVLLPVPAGRPPSHWEHCSHLLYFHLLWPLFPALLFLGCRFIKHKPNYILCQPKSLHFLSPSCMQGLLSVWPVRCSDHTFLLLPTVLVLLLPSLLPLGLAIASLYVKTQPSLHHPCPAIRLYL